MKDFEVIEKTMLETRKRTTIDGKTWWCVFDAENMRWSTIVLFGRYKTKRDCQVAIDSYKRLNK